MDATCFITSFKVCFEFEHIKIVSTFASANFIKISFLLRTSGTIWANDQNEICFPTSTVITQKKLRKCYVKLPEVHPSLFRSESLLRWLAAFFVQQILYSLHMDLHVTKLQYAVSRLSSLNIVIMSISCVRRYGG